MPFNMNLDINSVTMPVDPCWDPATDPADWKYSYLHYLVPQSTFDIVLGLGLALGTAASTIPQIMKVAKRKSSVGLSEHMLLLAAFNQYSFLLNVFMMEFPRFEACFESFSECWDNQISWFQAFLLWLCYFIVWCEFIYYRFKEQGKSQANRKLVINFVIFITFAIVCTILVFPAGVKVGPCDETYSFFGLAFSILSTACTIMEWGPQIYTTYKLKSAGSLSVIMMSIQCPGCWLMIIYYIVTQQHWTSFITWIFSGVQETILLYLLWKYRHNTSPSLLSPEEHATGLLDGDDDILPTHV